MTAEEKAFAYLQDRDYAWYHNTANKLGRGLAGVSDVGSRIKGKAQAVSDTFKSGLQGSKNVSANQVAMKTAMKSNSKFDTDKERNIMLDKAKGQSMHRVVGGTAVGAVGGGLAGAGLAHLATSKSRKRIAFLESKGESMSNKERAELVAKKAKVRNAKVISGVAGAIGGGILGNKIGKGYARSNKLKLVKEYNAAKTAAINVHNESTKSKDAKAQFNASKDPNKKLSNFVGRGVVDRIQDRVNAKKAEKD